MNDIEKAIEVLRSIYPSQKEIKTGEYDHVADALDDAITALEHQLTDMWIPVTEKLPDKYGLYVVSVYYSEWICDYGTDDESYKEPESVVLTAEYCKSMNGNHKWILHEADGEITVNGNGKVFDDLGYWSTYIKAWQPLPEPWKETV